MLPDSVEEATGEWYVLPENGSILDEVFIILESLFTITNTLVHALPLPPCAEMRKSSEACISLVSLPPARLSLSSLGQCSVTEGKEPHLGARCAGSHCLLTLSALTECWLSLSALTISAH